MRKKLLFAFAMGMITLSATACSLFERPELNLDDAEEALVDEKYNVTYNDRVGGVFDEGLFGERIYGVEEYLSATYKDDSITIFVFDSSKTARLYFDTLKLEYDFTLKGLKNEINTYEHTLDKYDDDLSNLEIDALEDHIKTLKKQYEKYKDEYVIGRAGKKVWAGTVRAMKDSKD